MMWWNDFCLPERIYTVDDMYKEAKKNNIALLSTYGSGDDFWKEYRDNFGYFDAIFRRRYRSFCYFMQEYGSVLSDLTTEFTLACYGVLLKNAKKYSELFRVQTISDEDYNLLYNYDMTEIMDKDIGTGNTHQSKAHTDTMTNTVDKYQDVDTKVYEYGEHTKIDTNEVSAFNSSDYQPDSERQQRRSEGAEKNRQIQSYPSHLQRR